MKGLSLSKPVLITLILGSSLMVSTNALAIAATKIDKGVKSPYQGVLMDEYDFRYLLALEATSEDLQAKLSTLQVECSIAQNKCEIKEYWYSSPYLWLFIGVIAGVSLR